VNSKTDEAPIIEQLMNIVGPTQVTTPSSLWISALCVNDWQGT
jgi:hypothetical protein